MLLDEAQVPLIIAEKEKQAAPVLQMGKFFADLVKNLKPNQDFGSTAKIVRLT